MSHSDSKKKPTKVLEIEENEIPIVSSRDGKVFIKKADAKRFIKKINDENSIPKKNKKLKNCAYIKSDGTKCKKKAVEYNLPSGEILGNYCKFHAMVEYRKRLTQMND